MDPAWLGSRDRDNSWPHSVQGSVCCWVPGTTEWNGSATWGARVRDAKLVLAQVGNRCPGHKQRSQVGGGVLSMESSGEQSWDLHAEGGGSSRCGGKCTAEGRGHRYCQPLYRPGRLQSPTRERRPRGRPSRAGPRRRTVDSGQWQGGLSCDPPYSAVTSCRARQAKPPGKAWPAYLPGQLVHLEQCVRIQNRAGYPPASGCSTAASGVQGPALT